MLKELEYPFDAGYILSKKKRLKRELILNGKNLIEKRIAILGGSTTNEIKLILELFLLNNGISATFYESEYNQYYQDAVFLNTRLIEFSPDLIYICTTNRNISQFPSIDDEASIVDMLIKQEMDKFKLIWDNLRKLYTCPMIQNNFEMPFYRLLGNKDASDIHGKVNFISRLNMEFYEYAQSHESFYICDINYISADYGLKEWSNPFYYNMYKYAMNVNAIPYLSFNIANIIKSIFGKNKKGFVLDLDNTLWGGVIGDDGVDNIALGPEEPEGQAYSEFQRYLKEYKQLGIILNINSKNDYNNAISGLKHPNSELSVDDFIVIKANWDAKDKNFIEIANELNLLPESLVFIDDNPAERHIILEHIDGVCAPDIGLIRNYIQNIDRNGFFEVTTISNDDKSRYMMYKENSERVKIKNDFSDYNEYLLSLSMIGVIRNFEHRYYTRISQLSNKSNQFNLTTHRYTQSEIEHIANDDEYITLYGQLMDRFGDNGLVSVIIGRKKGAECHVDLWIMSCRVLKRDMEYAMMDSLVEKCYKSGIERIHGYYYPTEKNKMVSNFYELMGFTQIVQNMNGDTEWIFNLPEKYENKNKVIKVEE